MDTNTVTRPAFRKPWTNGAYAYFEADTFAAAREGFKRKRKSLIFHMSNDGEAGDRKCVTCGGTLREASLLPGSSGSPDRWSTWTYSPERKAVGNGQHYVCSWQSLLNRIFKIEV